MPCIRQSIPPPKRFENHLINKYNKLAKSINKSSEESASRRNEQK